MTVKVESVFSICESIYTETPFGRLFLLIVFFTVEPHLAYVRESYPPLILRFYCRDYIRAYV